MKYRIPKFFLSCLKKLYIPLSGIVIVCLLLILDGELKYSSNLEEQIYKRDSIIDQLAFSNDIVKEYFDIKTDTANNRMIYTLKEEKIKIEYQCGHEILSEEELLNLIKQLDKENNNLILEYNNLVGEYNSLYNDNINLRLSHNNERKKYLIAQDSTKNLKHVLKLIYDNYNIGYKIEKDTSDYTIIKITPSHEIDSALMLLPYYRDKLHYDEKSGNWTVIIDKKI